MKNQKGIAMVTVILVLIFLIPFLLYLLTTTRTYLSLSYKEKQLKMSGSLATNALVDFMRQFSQNYYEGHYDTDSLARDQAFYTVGFSAVSTDANSQEHRVFIHATGKYGKNPDSPLADKDLYTVVQFISDLTDYGTLIDGTFTISASNVTYYGKWWITGNLSISGSNVRFVGGPLIVGGNLQVTGTNCRIEGDVYYGGTLTGNPTVTGTKYNFYPSDMIYPNINETFYKANYNYKITTKSPLQLPSGYERGLKFEAYTSSSAFRIVHVRTTSPYNVNTTTVTVPVIESGMIILGENCNLTVYGTVRGRVTVGTTGTGSSAGKITVGLRSETANLLYYNPLTGGTTTSAIYGNSFSAIASNGITFRGKTTSPTADLNVCGVFFNRSTANMQAIGATSRKFTIYGTRNKPISLSGFTGGTALVYDVWLNRYPPAGLPERPILVTWCMR